MRQIFRRHYDALTLDQLYKMLALRSEIFVVEQECPYQDLDGTDADAYHIWIEDESGAVLSYLRVFSTEEKKAHIGRVVTRKDQRGKGLGLEVLLEGIRTAKEFFPGQDIILHAQTYATGFYEKAGFRVTGEEFLEDGIPHREMTLTAG